MTTGNMPNPPDHLTTQATQGDVAGQDAAGAAGLGAISDTGQATGTVTLNEEMARIFEEEADVIAQQMVYHSQIMFGVSAMGTDAVNARNSVLVVANALRNGAHAQAVNALANLGDAQITQVNDRTLPFKMSSQIAGLIEGLLLDSIRRAYREDAGKLREAWALLEGLFQSANEKALEQPKGLVAWQAPGPGPNARR